MASVPLVSLGCTGAGTGSAEGTGSRGRSLELGCHLRWPSQRCPAYPQGSQLEKQNSSSGTHHCLAQHRGAPPGLQASGTGLAALVQGLIPSS